ncbi:MAG TPA: ABC transporter permease, partial [Thermoplasmatales archaeon]|nr:ABC transporter permease [Thermoplasmatales archaeon]
MGKELRELLTPATVIPIVLMALILGSLGNAFGGIESELNEKPVVGVINEDNNSFSNVVTSILDVESKVVFSSTNTTDKQEGLRKLFQEEGVALIVIPKNFTQNIETGRVGNLRVYW